MRIALGSLVLLVILTVAVGLGGPVLAVDRFVAEEVADLWLFDVSDIAGWGSFLGSPGVIVPLTFIASAVVFAITRSWRRAVVPIGAVGTAGAIATIMKWLLPSSRLELNLPNPQALHAFPSGHTAATIALAGSLAFVLATGRNRLVALAAAAAVSAFMMASMVLLEIHWATDIAGGLLLGIAAVAGWLWFIARWAPIREPERVHAE